MQLLSCRSIARQLSSWMGEPYAEPIHGVPIYGEPNEGEPCGKNAFVCIRG